MADIAAAGTNEFIVGFRLAGIKETVEIRNDAFSELKALKSKNGIRVIVVDEKIMEKLEPYQRNEIEASVEPVFITLSTKTEQDSLKKLIKKSIGVDLWK